MEGINIWSQQVWYYIYINYSFTNWIIKNDSVYSCIMHTSIFIKLKEIDEVYFLLQLILSFAYNFVFTFSLWFLVVIEKRSIRISHISKLLIYSRQMCQQMVCFLLKKKVTETRNLRRWKFHYENYDQRKSASTAGMMRKI